MHRRLLAPLACGLVLVGACSSSDPLPKVDDPAQLVRVAEALLSKQGVVPREHWPAAIAALRPREVTVIGDQVVVTCEMATGVGARGYVVNPHNAPLDAHLHAQPTEAPGIYRFEWRP
jgi:hypothetical protein